MLSFTPWEILWEFLRKRLSLCMSVMFSDYSNNLRRWARTFSFDVQCCNVSAIAAMLWLTGEAISYTPKNVKKNKQKNKKNKTGPKKNCNQLVFAKKAETLQFLVAA